MNIEEALNKAFELGQRYWMYVDSEWERDWPKGDKMMLEFKELKLRMVAQQAVEPVPCLAATPQPNIEARLAWSGIIEPNNEVRYHHVTAPTPFGSFLITWKGWKEYDAKVVDETPWGDCFGIYDTLEEAKRYCETEYAIRLTLTGEQLEDSDHD